MIGEIQTMLDGYFDWLKDKTILNQVDSDWVEITTPHIDRHNDCLQIYVRKHNGGYVLTDDSNTISDLENSGCALDTPKRKALLKTTLTGFGVREEGKSIMVSATASDFALKKHSIIQAMLAVDDLFYTSAPHVAGFFFEDVQKWLDDSNIRYIPKIKLAGKSDFDHLFDFVIPKSKLAPERIVQTINNPGKSAVESQIFKWTDTRNMRAEDAKLYVVINDTEAKISQPNLDALQNYDAEPVPWSKHEEVQQDLTA